MYIKISIKFGSILDQKSAKSPLNFRTADPKSRRSRFRVHFGRFLGPKIDVFFDRNAQGAEWVALNFRTADPKSGRSPFRIHFGTFLAPKIDNFWPKVNQKFDVEFVWLIQRPLRAQASKQARKRVSEQASKQASKLASSAQDGRQNQQTSKQASIQNII